MEVHRVGRRWGRESEMQSFLDCNRSQTATIERTCFDSHDEHYITSIRLSPLLSLPPKRKMNGMSDLELVAQAMEVTIATQQTNLQRPLSPSTTQVADNTTTPPSTAPTTSSIAGSTAETLKALGLDLSKLSPADAAAMQPLLDALQLGLDGDSEEDDLRIAEILAQMDAAGEVADDLEEKLDLLLENLGKAEVEMQAALPKQ
jgi:hypothetical protein